MSHSCSHYSFHNCANCINEDVIHKRRVHTPISQINGRLHNTFYMFFVRRPAGPVCVGFCVFCPKVLVCCIILVEWSEVRPMQCLTVTLCYNVLHCDTVLHCDIVLQIDASKASKCKIKILTKVSFNCSGMPAASDEYNDYDKVVF